MNKKIKPKIAIIGAGIAGLTIATKLKNIAEVTVFEKARGVGGRMSTRFADPFYFDHGAQFFTARTKKFQQFLEIYMKNNIVQEWKGKVINFELGKKPSKRLWFEPHLIACPNMNSLCKEMAKNLNNIIINTEIAPLDEKDVNGWHIKNKQGELIGYFDLVISTAPPVQTVKLFEKYLPADNPMTRVKMQGCYSLMIGFNKKWDKSWIAAKVRDNPIKWISINSSKPQRNQDITSIVAHSRNNWAEEHIDDDVAEAQAFLLAKFQEISGIDCTNADYISSHRWRYAIVEETEKSGCYYDKENNIASVSDWCSTSRIEEVWLNADLLADDVKEFLV
jgi:renalase